MRLSTRCDVLKSSHILKTHKSWITLPQGKAGTETMKIASKWRTNMRVLGGLAFALDVAYECRWSHRWLIFILQVPKTHPGGKSFLKLIGLNTMCHIVALNNRCNIQAMTCEYVFVLMLGRRPLYESVIFWELFPRLKKKSFLSAKKKKKNLF